MDVLDDELQEISEDRIEEIKEAFKLFDTDGSGSITAQELQDFFIKIGHNPSKKQIDKMISEVHDGNTQNKDIDFNTFLRIVTRRMRDVDTEEELIESFKIFDKEGTGLISVEDLKNILLEFGDNNLLPDELEDVIAEADEDGHGFIQYENFVKNVMNN